MDRIKNLSIFFWGLFLLSVSEIHSSRRMKDQKVGKDPLKGDPMEISKSLNRFMTFLLKLYLGILAACVALQFLDSWIASIHFAIGTKIIFWLTLAAISVIAYFFRKSRSQSSTRTASSHGAERTPLMPRRGGRP